MTKEIIGSVFILISAILYSTKFLVAAIVGANSKVWDKKEFAQFLSYTPNSLNICIYICLIVGVIYFVWSFVDRFKEKY